MTEQRLTVVVGSGRCGSTALSNVLRMHPHVLSLSELFASLSPFPFPDGTMSGGDFVQFLNTPRPFTTSVMRHGFWPRVSEEVRQNREMPVLGAISVIVLPHLTDDPDRLLADLSLEFSERPADRIACHYRALFEWLGRRFGTRVAVERSGFSLHLVPQIRKLFPDARFVHLYRDGPDTAVSMSLHPVFQVLRVLREHAEHSGRDLQAEMAEMFRHGEVDVRPILEEEVPVAAFGRMWSETIVEGLGYLADVQEPQLRSFAFEDILDRPDDELTRLAEFLGVDPLPEWLKAGRAELDVTRRGAAQKLPPQELADLRASCEPGIRALESSLGR